MDIIKRIYKNCSYCGEPILPTLWRKEEKDYLCRCPKCERLNKYIE